jgi:hypothetical protein
VEVSANPNEWEAFDIVVITIPVPQVLQLGNIETFLLGKRKHYLHVFLIQEIKLHCNYYRGLEIEKRIGESLLHHKICVGIVL